MSSQKKNPGEHSPGFGLHVLSIRSGLGAGRAHHCQIPVDKHYLHIWQEKGQPGSSWNFLLLRSNHGQAMVAAVIQKNGAQGAVGLGQDGKSRGPPVALRRFTLTVATRGDRPRQKPVPCHHPALLQRNTIALIVRKGKCLEELCWKRWSIWPPAAGACPGNGEGMESDQPEPGQVVCVKLCKLVIGYLVDPVCAVVSAARRA